MKQTKLSANKFRNRIFQIAKSWSFYRGLAMSTTSYWIDIRHEGLHAYRRITGRDQYVVEAKATAQNAAWEEKWDKMQQREMKLYTKEQKKDAAAQQTQK